MIFRYLQNSVEVKLPEKFNSSTMGPFISQAVEGQSSAKTIYFDFADLRFVEPEGVVVLANTIEHLRQGGVKVIFKSHTRSSEANRYLDDSGFFLQYLGKRVSPSSSCRDTTMPLKLFQADAYVPYLYRGLMPWIGQEVKLSSDTLETIKACLEEIFHNIDYHSGVKTGCTLAQYFPKKNRICIAISDFGVGIPNRVRTKLPELTDPDALRKACQEGFTTKSNVRNRGAGLPNLIRYVTQKNSGTVLIHSGEGYLSATQGAEFAKVTSRKMSWTYPGTMVRVLLRTDTLERLESDIEPEEFQW